MEEVLECWVDDVILEELGSKEGTKLASGEWDLGAKEGRKKRPVTRNAHNQTIM